MPTDLRPGDWVRLGDGQAAQVVDVEAVWGRRTARVFLPERGTMLRVPIENLAEGAAGDPRLSAHFLAYAAAAARIADALERDALLAPLQAPVIPLPHQIYALSRAMSGDRVRYLLADEVGLGKTIEAGLVLRELKMRGLVRRCLVVAPAGLVTQWVQEMRTHFNEEFRLVLPGELSALRRLAGMDEGENAWRLYDHVVCPVDSVKPLDGRRGWTREQVARFNQERHDDLIGAGWDLVIVDEAHRLGGSSARYRLGEALATAAPYMLLLSATPHQGKTEGFRKIMGFLDVEAFPDDGSVSRDRVAPYVIRTEKKHAIDADGKPLFSPRQTQLLPVSWGSAHADQRALYEAVTEYVRTGYNQAIREKRTAVGFLMVLMQRLVTSSSRAIRTSLERRLEVLELPEGQLSLFPEEIGDEWEDLNGQEQLEAILKARIKGLRNERAEVELLLSAARRCEAKGPDAKAETLLAEIQRLQREEGDPAVKVLVFTEFVPTQEMLVTFLEERGFPVIRLNGSMGLDERRKVQAEFAGGAQILVSTEAGGEGLNLQFCHAVVNYDLPWNPMRLEQRIGRVDRIGQTHIVRAMNLTLNETVEERVREVLEEKLARILEEFGVDKLADVLDTTGTDLDFDRLYVDAVISPSEAGAKAEALADEIRRRIREAQQGAALLTSVGPHDPERARQLADHQMPFWIERMTLAYLRSHAHLGASAREDKPGYALHWPDGSRVEHAVFGRDAGDTGAVTLTIEDERVRSLITRLPFVPPGAGIPAVEMPDISDKVSGIWSLWRIALETPERSRQRLLPMFVADDGRILAPSARVVWERLVDSAPASLRFQPNRVAGEEAHRLFDECRLTAEQQGQSVYQELLASHQAYLTRERKKGTYAFEARRKAIERIGLPQVRDRRRGQLEKERREWEQRMEERSRALPSLTAIAFARVARQGELG